MAEEQFVLATFTADKIKKLHPAERIFVTASSFACNQLSTWRIFSIIEDFEAARKHPEKAFIFIRHLVFLRLSVGSIFEFNNLNSTYFGQIRHIYPSRFDGYRKLYSPISKLLQDNRWIVRLRNKLTFHFDPTYIGEIIDKVDKKAELHFVFGRKQGELAYFFAEEIISLGLIDEIGNGNHESGVRRLQTFCNQATSSIIDYHSHVVKNIFEQNGMFSNREEIMASPDSYAEIGKTRLPVFVRGRDMDERGVVP